MEMKAAIRLDLEGLRKKAGDVFKSHPEIRMAYLYGSMVQKGGHRFSDIDVGVVLMSDFKVGPLYTVKVQHELEDACKEFTLIKLSNVPDSSQKPSLSSLPFDVHVLNHVSPQFLNDAVRKGLLLYCTDETFKDDFELRVMHDYFDFKPYLELFQSTYLQLNLGERNE